MADLRLEGITKRFGKVIAIDNLSLHVRSHEFVVLVGASGCGKTTLLRVVAGLERAESGEIYMGGECVNQVSVGKRNVQMIFQSYALWPHMKVFDRRRYSNLGFPLKIRNWTPDAIVSRVQDVARRVGLEDALFSRRPDTLSAGQRQRVALSRALTTAPQIFLMDEPMANLDPPSRTRVRYEIKKLHREMGTTTLFVTHNMTDAFEMADRMAIMRDGKIAQIGTEEELRRHPADQYVVDFLHS